MDRACASIIYFLADQNKLDPLSIDRVMTNVCKIFFRLKEKTDGNKHNIVVVYL